MKLSQWEKREMKARIRGGARAEFIAREYGVTRNYANEVIREVKREGGIK